MTLDELLKQNAAWLEQAKKRRVFEKIDEKTVKYPEEQRAQRIEQLKARVNALFQRKGEAIASYDRAIALEQAELDSLEEQKPSTPQKPAQDKGDKPRGTKKK